MNEVRTYKIEYMNNEEYTAYEMNRWLNEVGKEGWRLSTMNILLEDNIDISVPPKVYIAYVERITK